MDKLRLTIAVIACLLSTAIAACPPPSSRLQENSTDLTCQVSSQISSSKLKKFLALALLLSQSSNTKKPGTYSLPASLRDKKYK